MEAAHAIYSFMQYALIYIPRSKYIYDKTSKICVLQERRNIEKPPKIRMLLYIVLCAILGTLLRVNYYVIAFICQVALLTL